MRLFASSGQAATSPALAHSSRDEAGEVIENSHTRRAGCSVLQSSGGKSRSLERYSGAPRYTSRLWRCCRPMPRHGQHSWPTPRPFRS
ncbi:GD19296 [Drosophila simulans]|uniref:GD19296 n=1 Tax=Drosophila simulans TaxID=7240 RepID=B4QTC7_DROSI|nr:GD19296 [Drosophila simulans]